MALDPKFQKFTTAIPLLASYDMEGKLAGVKDRRMTELLTSDIQQQQDVIENHQQQNNDLKTRIEALENK